MSRYTGPSWKVSRRLGFSLSGTGKELSRRPYAPGQHGQDRRGSLSEYGLQLREKQKLRMTYGLTERQFSNLFKRAGKIREGKHGDNFMILLERRLDNVVYRLGLASTRRQARQLVNHGHITVDGKRVDIPSFEVKVGQVISVRDKSKNLDVIKNAVEAVVARPSYVEFDADKLEGKLVRLPEREDMNADIDEDTVDFTPNYDNKLKEPTVLPAAIPNMLVNGGSGIAVGMATNMATHNLGEVVAAAKHLMAHPDATLEELMRYVPGPDWPGGGIIIGRNGIREAYETGRGTLTTRSMTHFENVTARKKAIVVTELPFMVGPERVLERISEGVKNRKLEGISGHSWPHG